MLMFTTTTIIIRYSYTYEEEINLSISVGFDTSINIWDPFSLFDVHELDECT